MSPLQTNPHPRSTPPRRPAIVTRSAFTLVELLTVIAIIVILMAILLPTVSRVRQQALVTRTLQEINSISSAIERYKVEQGAYPGPLPNSAFATGAGPGVTGGSMTMTENMVLGVCGGWDPTNPPAAQYVEASVGLGPISHNVNPNKRSRTPAYQDPTPGQLMPNKAGTGWGANGKVGPSDSNIPEFMDQFQNAMPIMYMRANIGATNVIPGYPSAGVAQYDPDNWLKPYGWVTPSTTDFPAKTVNGTNVPAGAASYFVNTTLPNVARGQNTYMLISFGLDSKPGTKDDIVFP